MSNPKATPNPEPPMDLAAERRALDDERRALLRARAEVTAESQVRAMAIRLGFRNPEVARRLIDLADLDLDTEGGTGARNVLAVLEQLARDEPYLLRPGGRA